METGWWKRGGGETYWQLVKGPVHETFYSIKRTAAGCSPPSGTPMLLFTLGFFNHSAKPQFSSHVQTWPVRKKSHICGVGTECNAPFCQQEAVQIQQYLMEANTILGWNRNTCSLWQIFFFKKTTTAGRAFWFLRWEPPDYTLSQAECLLSAQERTFSVISPKSWNSPAMEVCRGSISNGKQKCSLLENILGG